MTLSGVTEHFAVRFEIAVGATISINTETGVVTGATSGTSQVETATVVAAGGATSSGNLAVTVTAAGVTGSPLAIPVALVTGVDTTASLIAAKIRTALNANAALVAVYTVGGTGADVNLTRTIPAANDPTLNIAITAGLGVSAVTSSTNTTAGVQPTKAYRIAGQAWGADDYQGVPLTGLTTMKGYLVQSTSGTTEWSVDSKDRIALSGTESELRFNNDGLLAAFVDDWEFTAVTASVVTLYFFGL